jgi:Protein of unknown function (DUF3828)
VKFFKAIALITLCSIAAQTAQAERSNTEQEKVVLRLYRDFAWEASLQDSPFESLYYQSRVVLLKYFEPSLADLLVLDANCARKEGECNLDFDPIFDTQDPYVVSIEVTQTSKSHEIIASFNRGLPKDKQYAITYQLKQVKDGWRIANIVYKNGRTLKQALGAK